MKRPYRQEDSRITPNRHCAFPAAAVLETCIGLMSIVEIMTDQQEPNFQIFFELSGICHR